MAGGATTPRGLKKCHRVDSAAARALLVVYMAHQAEPETVLRKRDQSDDETRREQKNQEGVEIHCGPLIRTIHQALLAPVGSRTQRFHRFG